MLMSESMRATATTTATPPPAYEEWVQIAPVVPPMGDVSKVSFDQMVISRLERLEAGQNRIEAGILGLQQSQTCNQTRGRRSLQLYYQRFRSTFVNRSRHSLRMMKDRLKAQGIRVEDYVTAYSLLIFAKVFRFLNWGLEFQLRHPTDFDVDPAHHEQLLAEIAEGREMANESEEEARCLLEFLKTGRRPEGVWILWRERCFIKTVPMVIKGGLDALVAGRALRAEATKSGTL
ncbi:hypothetical protein BR93DRAFT_930661 [Coniochaeta sp. PMI_546]|nr:hypothetical protein BR93DRAFT_930661 [Coniochaeta sp. PMI_546]